MNAEVWCHAIKQLPPHLTQYEAARRVGKPEQAVRYWLLKCDYPFVDGRTLPWPEQRRKVGRKLNPEDVVKHKNKSNTAIAKMFNVSRERVRQVREALGIKKVNGRK